MKKVIKLVAGKSSYMVGLGVASLVGGLTSAIVLAAVPDAGGTIHGCSNKLSGAVKVVDTENGGACNTLLENSLDWEQGGKTLKDGSAQALGTLLNVNLPNETGTQMTVFNDSLKRTVVLSLGTNDGDVVRIGQLNYPSYSSTDCTGTGYVQSTSITPVKTVLFRSLHIGTPTHFIVADSAQPASVTIRSSMSNGAYGEPDVCQTYEQSWEGSYYAITPVTLPFTTPLSTPFKF
ncbi:MAG TPA: hypothetical protein VF733_06160 [Candidatus Saccharimonadales bacterium]